MKPEWREKILAYNRQMAERKVKASDLDVLIATMFTLPYGQLKKMLTEPVMAILEKYGIQADTEQRSQEGEHE